MPFFRQLRDEVSGTFSYLIGCPCAGRALIIDPVDTQTTLYMAVLAELNLKLEWVLETHLHGDHVTAADALRTWAGARVAVGRYSGIQAADRLLDDGECIRCGETVLGVLSTPGHTPGCLSFSWGDRMFTGDSLLIGACGRTDEPGSDGPRLFDSVMRRLLSQPDETLVYPGHCLAGRRVSSVGEERERNPFFHGTSRDSFVMLKPNRELPDVKIIALEANRQCGRLPMGSRH